MTQIKNLIFDLGVVLVNLDREGCIRAFKELGIDQIEKLTSLAGHQGIFGDYERGVLSTSEFYDRIRQLAGRDIPDHKIRGAWLQMVSDLPSYKLDKLLELKSRYRIFLLSNTNELHWDWCAETMFRYQDKSADDFFEKRWLSNEIHLLKPSREIFEYILTDGNLNPEETFFLDDAEPNCRMAETLGIRTYQPSVEEDWTFLFNQK